MKIAVVTGTSSGIGLATSVHLARNGYRVFAGVRDLAKCKALHDAITAESLPVDVVQMDVCDAESVARAFVRIAEVGPVDVLINNAGVSGSSPLELTTEVEHRRMFETNYFGAVRCVQAVVPEMRERGAGCIVNISSAAGLLATPTQIAYSASKWALECMSEALAHELLRFGVRVVTIEPGVIMTRIFENAAPHIYYDKKSPYQPVMRRIGKLFAAGFQRGTPPEAVAETILESITTRDYKLRWPVGVDAKGIHAARGEATTERWVRMGGDLEDDDYDRQFAELFGVTL